MDPTRFSMLKDIGASSMDLIRCVVGSYSSDSPKMEAGKFQRIGPQWWGGRPKVAVGVL